MRSGRPGAQRMPTCQPHFKTGRGHNKREYAMGGIFVCCALCAASIFADLLKLARRGVEDFRGSTMALSIDSHVTLSDGVKMPRECIELARLMRYATATSAGYADAHKLHPSVYCSTSCSRCCTNSTHGLLEPRQYAFRWYWRWLQDSVLARGGALLARWPPRFRYTYTML